MDEISYEVFAERLDQPFVLRRHDTAELGEPVAAVLVGCSRYPDNGCSPGYNLTFRTALPAPAQQANYLVESDSLTPTPIFLVRWPRHRTGWNSTPSSTNSTEDENVL